MSKFFISESRPLNGKVRVSGAKNSVLPIIAASMLGDGESEIHESPALADVRVMCELLRCFGSSAEFDESACIIKINPGSIGNYTAPYELANKMRASFLVMGPMLARTGIARISLPGGCAIGSRPVDLHLKGFSSMGAEISQGHGYIEAKVNGQLKGSKIYLDFPSVGATENIIMAATLANGQTILQNAATEPEIVDLCSFLASMGADISGGGTDTVVINGVKELKACTHAVIPDRIEAGTFMIAAAITGGEVLIENVITDHLKPISAKLMECGIEVTEEQNSIRVSAMSRKIKPVDIKTLPYPGFPTDMQAQMTALLCKAEGASIIVETIFENRFMHLSELKRMGANIKIEGRSAIVEGGSVLQGAQVKATDLRAGAALVLAGLTATGITEISDIDHIERGYVNIDKKLNALGANISRVDN